MEIIRDKRIARYGNVLAIAVTREAHHLGLEPGDEIEITLDIPGYNGSDRPIQTAKTIRRYGSSMAITITREADALGLERGDWIELSIVGIPCHDASGLPAE